MQAIFIDDNTTRYCPRREISPVSHKHSHTESHNYMLM